MKKLGILLLLFSLASCGFYFGVGNSEMRSGDLEMAGTTDGGSLSSDTANDIDPFMYYDMEGQGYLFFASDRDGGDYDIYYAKKNGDLFETARRIEDSRVNGPSDETSPILYYDYGTSYTNLILLLLREDMLISIQLTNLVHSDYSDTNFDAGPQARLGSVASYDSQNVDGIIYFSDTGSAEVAYRTPEYFDILNVNPIEASAMEPMSGGTGIYQEETPTTGISNYSFYLMETKTNGYSQIAFSYGSGTIPDMLSGIITNGTNIWQNAYQSLSLGINDRSPHIDIRDNGKLYFASDRYKDSGSYYDLYRFNTESAVDKQEGFFAELESLLSDSIVP